MPIRIRGTTQNAKITYKNLKSKIQISITIEFRTHYILIDFNENGCIYGFGACLAQGYPLSIGRNEEIPHPLTKFMYKKIHHSLFGWIRLNFGGIPYSMFGQWVSLYHIITFY